MEVEGRPFTAAVAAKAAGVSTATLSKWQQRHGLFADVRPAAEWMRYSLADICTVRLIVALTAQSINPKNAIEFANFVAPFIMVGPIERDEAWFVLFQHGRKSRNFTCTTGAEKLADIMTDMGPCVTAIDLRSVVRHVTAALGLTALNLEPENAES